MINRPNTNFAGWRVALLSALAIALLAPAAVAQSNNQCDEPGEAPDVIVGSLHQERRWGAVGDITAFSIGTTSCNIGTCWLQWIAGNNNHPVIGQSMYRLKDGRFEQLGQSWLKHGFFALSGSLCSGAGGCIPTGGAQLGVGCSDPYSAPRNGDQGGLGPKFEVNASTGVYPFPPTGWNQTGNTIYKRVQVHNDDLDPALNAGAQYFVDGHYVTKDDSAAGNNNNNSSYRPIAVFQSGSNFDINLLGSTQREMPAIQAWQDNDASVELDFVDIDNDGRFIIGAKATDLGTGYWHYEYAVMNLNSHRSAREFSVPVLAIGDLQNIGFHDVDYHSGEPWDGTDWLPALSEGATPRLTWSTETATEDLNANALRWGTIYNFRFDVDLPPIQGDIEIGMFLGGTPDSFTVTTIVPGACNLNGFCDAGEDVCNCLGDCTPTVNEIGGCFDAVDNDCDGAVDCADLGDCCGEASCSAINVDKDLFGQCEDCDDLLGTVWATPSEVLDVDWNVTINDDYTLRWSEPNDIGADEVTYEALRSLDPSDFGGSPGCLGAASPSTKRLIDNDVPALGSVYNYLIRGTNGCPQSLGDGSLGSDSDGLPRTGATCP